MPKPVAETGNKNLIGSNLIALRKKHHLSQRALAHELQLKGYDIDKNVITRIETTFCNRYRNPSILWTFPHHIWRTNKSKYEFDGLKRRKPEI